MNYQTAFSAVQAIVNGLDDNAQLALCSDLISLVHGIGLKSNMKLLDNYNFRTNAMHQLVKSAIWDDVKLSLKRTGNDASSVKYNLADIEFKSFGDNDSKNPLKTSFMWDKQNDATRRKETLGSNAFVFGRFEMEKLAILLVAKEPSTVNHITNLLEAKQAPFLEKWQNNLAQNKRGGSDAIRLSFEEMLLGDAKWHLWVGGTWHKDLESANCIILIQSQQKPKVKKEKTAEEKTAIAAKAKATREAKNQVSANSSSTNSQG